MRSLQIDYDTAVSTSFGYNRAFSKPTDWCLTSAVCSDEYFSSPPLNYRDEGAYWYADIDTIYVRFVSDDSAYGGDLSLWTPKFTEFVAAHFAGKIILKLSGDKTKWEMIEHPRTGIRKKKLDEAKSHDAMADPVKFLPPGGWRHSRRNGGRSGDGGSTGSLTG